MSEPKKHQKALAAAPGSGCARHHTGDSVPLCVCRREYHLQGAVSHRPGSLCGSVMETSAAKFLAYLCYSEEEIAEIRARNAVVETAEVTEQTGFAQRTRASPRIPSSWWMSPAPPSRARCSLSMIPPGSKSPWRRSFPRRPQASGWRTSPSRKMPWLPSTAADSWMRAASARAVCPWASSSRTASSSTAGFPAPSPLWASIRTTSS